MRDAKDVVPYDVVGCCHQKATRYFEKSGLANKECVVSALSVSLTTATSPRVRGRFDEKNASKDHIVKHGVPANPDLWGEGATTIKASNDVTTSLRTILR